MKSDFDMIIHKFDKSISVYPISDIHYGAIEHCKNEWKMFCKGINEDKNAYIILGGDLVNNSIRSSVANPFDEVVRPREQKRHMVEYLKPISHKILCAVSGNHEYRTEKETDSDITYDILSKLDIEDLYRQNIAFMKVSCDDCAYTFAVTHGSGGGIYTGATVNRNERFGNIIDGCDCLIVGHTHKGTVTKPSKIVIDAKNNTVGVKYYTVVSCVSWLNYGGYAARKMLLPASSANPQKIILASGYHALKKIEVVW